jgi:hypothetical protein
MYGYLAGRRMNIDSLSAASQTAAAERIAFFLHELHGLRPSHDIMEVARLYEHPDLDQLQSKVRYFALADQIGTILEGPGRPLDGQAEAASARVRQFLREDDGGW